MKKFKLRHYKLSGPNKGNLEKETFHNSAIEMIMEYNRFFIDHDRQKYMALDPTLWTFENDQWIRLTIKTYNPLTLVYGTSQKVFEF